MAATARKTSLSQRYPWRLEVPLFIFVSITLLVIGLSLPLMKVEKLIFWKNEYSVFTGVVALFHENELLLAAVLFFFSMVFPFAKLVTLLVLWWVRLKEESRQTVLRWLGALGKWSMLDVFATSVLIVLVKLGPLANVTPQEGLYFFCAAILCAMLTTMYVEHLARAGHKG
jgi:paraquat-inducible protein A